MATLRVRSPLFMRADFGILSAYEERVIDPATRIAELERALAERDEVLAQKDAALAALAEDAQDKATTIKKLRHDLDLLARQLFGRKAERVDPNQLMLAFAEAAEVGETPPPFVDEAPDEESARRKRKRRKRNGRLPLPKDLPRERREIHPPEHELVCPCGSERHKIGEEVTEELDYRPACFKVIEHARIKYACPSCQEGVVCPELPPFPIDKKRPSRPSARLLAEVIVSKYGDHLPLNRLEGVLARHGVRIPKSTLCDWIRDVAFVLRPVVDQVRLEVLSNDVVQTDETGIRVRDPTLHRATKAGRIWVYAGLPGQVHFCYTPTKEGKHTREYLAGYRGYLQADAYSGFDRLYQDGSIVEVACWAHARRKFFEAKDTAPIQSAWALAAIQRLFKVDREATEAGLDPSARKALREEKSKAIVDGLFEWLRSLSEDVAMPKSPLGKAVGYALNQEGALRRFLEDGRLKLDNNRAERSLRKVAVGRKNWLFAGSAKGAERGAALYTLVVSCRELGINPADYLADVITKAAGDFPDRLAAQLTPCGWQRARAGSDSAAASSSTI